MILWYNVNLQAFRTDKWTGYGTVPPKRGAVLQPHARHLHGPQAAGRRCRRGSGGRSRRGLIVLVAGAASSPLWSWWCSCAAGRKPLEDA